MSTTATLPKNSTPSTPEKLRAHARHGLPWSFRLGAILGIDIYAHFTLVLLVAWVAFSHRMHGLEAMVGGAAAVGALFVVIVAHELGHALTARRFGVRTLDITLLPIGGVANMERIPEQPVQELLIAAAGPLVNVVLGLVALVAAAASNALGFNPGVTSFLTRLLWINLALAAFNLLPAFPMDGGRVARALLAMHMEFPRATRIAAGLGQVAAIALAFAGLFFHPMLLFVALLCGLARPRSRRAPYCGNRSLGCRRETSPSPTSKQSMRGRGWPTPRGSRATPFSATSRCATAIASSEC